MREIKFRAWDLLENKMYYFDFDDLLTGNAPVNSTCLDYELMQYTGLKDKNGKEIYEGDIIKADGVLYDTVAFVLKDMMQGNWKNLENKEVIGNIYENPELVK